MNKPDTVILAGSSICPAIGRQKDSGMSLTWKSQTAAVSDKPITNKLILNQSIYLFYYAIEWQEEQMKRSKMMNLLLTGALSVSMLAGGVVSALAADNHPGNSIPASEDQQFTTKEDLKISKIINYADGVTVPAQTFNFEIIQDVGASVAQAEITSPVTISSNVIPAVTTAGAGKYNQIVLESDALTLPEYTTPGMYVYTVKETSTNNLDDDDYGWTMNTNGDTYVLRVFVKANGDIIYTITNKDEKKIDDIKPSDPDKDGYVEGGFSFTNQYTKKGEKDVTSSKGSLTISKTISGTYADSKDQFEYTVTFTDVSINPQYTLTAANGSSATITGSNGSASFTLKGGESVYFSNIPAGTYYTVTETMKSTNSQTYNASYVATQNGNTSNSVSGVSAKNLLVGEGANSVAFTNEAKDITITGLALQAAPYAALIGLGIALMAAYVFMRRRAENL